MKVTQSASLQSVSATAQAKRRAVMGGIVTPQAVAAHVRQASPTTQAQPSKRRAVMGGIVTPQAVAMHVRKMSAAPEGQADLGGAPRSEPAKRRAVMGGIVTPQAVAAHVRGKMNAGQRSI
jgi:hypothetical protein